MCGIAGIYDSKHSSDAALLKQMADSIAHRGPDGEGFAFFNDCGISLAHRRLAIIDVSERGHQPMFDSSGRYCIVYNGELYNFQALRNDLQKRGYQFRSDSDTEVVINAYAEFGESCLDLFNGEFAFCIFDKHQRTLFFARDAFGVKPLYYYWNGATLVFASEIKAILRAPFVPADISEQGIADFLAYGFTKAPGTAFKFIHTLPAGHKMLLQDGKLTISEYWRWQHTPRQWSENDAFEALEEALNRSVERKLVSDVPIGSFLSGGVDSSLVSLYAARHHTALNTFSIGFHDKRKDESHYAQQAATHIGSKHHVFYCDQSILDHLYKISWHLDEPFSDFSVLPTYLLAQQTRKLVTVALSGDGSDELLGGYSYHRWLHLITQAQRLPQWSFKAANLVLANVSNVFSDTHPLTRVAKLSHYAAQGKSQFIIDRYMKFSGTQIAQLLGTENYQSPEATLRRNLESIDDALTQFDIKYGLEQDMLVKVDRMAMANSLEVRVPFLDMELVKLIQTLPSSLKINRGETKYLLKKVAASHLGRNLVYRKKQGFSAPLAGWQKAGFGQAVDRHVLGSDSSLNTVLDHHKLIAMLKHRPSQQEQMVPLLYQLISLDIWLKNLSQNRLKEPLVG
jgi:asparagine synthase (glutamine-hydrolysing)